MNQKMRNHIEMLFENAPKTRKAFELKEELLANSEERYQDLLASGVSEEDAYKNVVNSIGNVSELFQGLEEVHMKDKSEVFEKMKKMAKVKTIAIGIYLFSIVVLITFIIADQIVNRNANFLTGYGFPFMDNRQNFILYGVLLMLLIDIVPTCMLVYYTSLYSKYDKLEDTLVEDFKEWKSSSLKTRSIKSAISWVLWAATILLYFAISFATYAWYSTWIIFLVALCCQAVIELLFRLKELKE